MKNNRHSRVLRPGSCSWRQEPKSHMRSSTLACADTVLDRVSEKLSVRSSQHRATAAQKQQQIGHRELDLEEWGHQRGSAPQVIFFLRYFPHARDLKRYARWSDFHFHVSRAQRAPFSPLHSDSQLLYNYPVLLYPPGSSTARGGLPPALLFTPGLSPPRPAYTATRASSRYLKT